MCALVQKVVHAELRAGQYTEISFLLGALPQTKSEWNKWNKWNSLSIPSLSTKGLH